MAVTLLNELSLVQDKQESAAPESKSALSFTPPFCAALQTALCVLLLTGREIETGKLYVADLLDMEMERLF